MTDTYAVYDADEPWPWSILTSSESLVFYGTYAEAKAFLADVSPPWEICGIPHLADKMRGSKKRGVVSRSPRIGGRSGRGAR